MEGVDVDAVSLVLNGGCRQLAIPDLKEVIVRSSLRGAGDARSAPRTDRSRTVVCRPLLRKQRDKMACEVLVFCVAVFD